MRSLDFVVNRFFMKLFNTNFIYTVKHCQDYFDFDLPSVMIEKRRRHFWAVLIQLKEARVSLYVRVY